MDRKQFLKTCAGGFCACAAASGLAGAAAAADDPAKEDWRWSFLQRRYAKLIGMLSEQMDEETLKQTLIALGTYCSAEYDQMLAKYRGDPEGFAEQIRKTSSGDIITYDKARKVVTMTSPERSDCFCPLNSVKAKTPAAVCNCSLGWQQHSWETVLEKKVRVELKEAVLRGGKRCTFEIHILDA